MIHSIVRGDYRQSLRSIKDVVHSADERGFSFESWLADELRRRGVLDAKALHNSSLPFDVVSESEGMRIQCKYSLGYRNTFDLRPARPLVGSTVRRYRQGDFDYFSVYLAHFDELYIFSAAERPCPDYAGMISGKFSRSRMRDHLDAWHLIFGGSRKSLVRQKIFSF